MPLRGEVYLDAWAVCSLTGISGMLAVGILIWLNGWPIDWRK